jgi:hypothetical protein
MNEKSPLSIEYIAPSSTLLQRVLTAIYQKQEQHRLWRVRLFATSALFSIGALVPVVINLVTTIKASNFGIYMSLLFSDGTVVLWKDISASLIESLPAISIGITLALVGILLWSIQKMVRFMDIGTMRTI